VRVPSTLVHSPSSESIFKYEYLNHKRSSLVPPFAHLNRTCLPKTSVRKTLDTGVKLYSSKPQTIGKTFDTGVKLYSSKPQTIDSDTTFDTGVKLYSSKPQTIGSDITCWVIRGGKTGKISQE